MNLKDALQVYANEVEHLLDAILPPVSMPQGKLHEAMRYAVLGGGKRLRAFLVMETGKILGSEKEACLQVAAAIEMMHGYSLIHDDLPAMDDSTLRRGRTTCHLMFGEAAAILAGDALQAMAFDVITRNGSPIAEAARAPIAADLARTSGALGMCGGQMLDLLGEEEMQCLDDVLLTQQLKTGALFRFSATATCHLKAPGQPGQVKTEREALTQFSKAFGLAFQIRDDILDLTGDEEAMGKDLRRDAQAGKSTVLSHLQLDGALRRLDELRDEALEAIDRLPGDVSLLRELVYFSINRNV